MSVLTSQIFSPFPSPPPPVQVWKSRNIYSRKSTQSLQKESLCCLSQTLSQPSWMWWRLCSGLMWPRTWGLLLLPAPSQDRGMPPGSAGPWYISLPSAPCGRGQIPGQYGQESRALFFSWATTHIGESLCQEGLCSRLETLGPATSLPQLTGRLQVPYWEIQA